jgi:hypothetical protein
MDANLVRPARLLVATDVVQLVGLVVAELSSVTERWDWEAEEATFEAKRQRGRKLEDIGSRALIPVGLAAVSDSAGAPTLRAAVASVTPKDLVLLDADAVRDPQTEFDRIPRSEVAGARIVDEYGDAVVFRSPSRAMETKSELERVVIAAD